MNEDNQSLPALPDLPQNHGMPQADNATFSFSVPVGAPPSRWQRFWRKFGGDGFLISVGFHVALIIIALTVVVTKAVIEGKAPELIATGAGGGSSGDKVTMTEHRIKPKNARNMAKTPSRLVAKGASAISIPDMPNINNMFADSTSLLGVASKGIGGGGGGGSGGGIGPGVGGGRNLVSLFGTRGFNSGGLEGTFYDLKQTHDGKAADPGVGGYQAIMRNFFTKDKCDESTLQGKYFMSDVKLYLTQVLIPLRQGNAVEAPRAFSVEGKVQPKRWMAYYRGSVKAPFSGKFRFVGMADDWLVVRWGGKLALEGGYGGNFWETGDGVIKDAKKNPLPGTTDTYPYGGGRPAMRCGRWLEVKEGEYYPIEIAMGETPGREFCAALAFERQGQKGKLLLFRTIGGDLPKEAINGSKGMIPSNIDLKGGDLIWVTKRANTRRSRR
ncbi:MAG: hypothetical protein LBD01_02450 [Puniceicoccales bacterium]|jgi:hypothetical protein|nr:hypothetical protein [Puniceicoccales bacterium]